MLSMTSEQEHVRTLIRHTLGPYRAYSAKGLRFLTCRPYRVSAPGLGRDTYC